MILLPSELKEIFDQVESSGYKIYLVGGYIRDSLLGVFSDDYDLTSNLPLEEVENIIKGSMVIEKKGYSFLSIKVLFKGKKVEITNMRIEGPYDKLGYPSKVVSTDDIYQDLKRRDFTINAMAYSPKDGLIDPYKGQIDIKHKVIKTIKNPYESYKEDPTRILRAFRFSFKYKFEIDVEDLKAIESNKSLIKKLSPHQLQKELSKFSESELKLLTKKGII